MKNPFIITIMPWKWETSNTNHKLSVTIHRNEKPRQSFKFQNLYRFQTKFKIKYHTKTFECPAAWSLLQASRPSCSDTILYRESYQKAKVLGIPAPHARTGGVLIFSHRRDKAHWHNILRGSAKPPTSTGESPYYLEIEKRLQHNTWRRRITSLKLNSQLSCCTCRCCHCSSPLSLLFSTFLTTLISVCSTLLLPIYRQEWCHQLQLFFNKGGCQLQHFFNNSGCQPLTSWMGAHGWCNSSCSCCNCQWLLHINGNQPNRAFFLQNM